MHWRLADVDYELADRDGFAVLFEAQGEPLWHDYAVADFERELVDGGYRLMRVAPRLGREVGVFRGFLGRVQYAEVRAVAQAAGGPRLGPRLEWRPWRWLARGVGG